MTTNILGDSDFSRESMFGVCDKLAKPSPPIQNYQESKKDAISLTWKLTIPTQSPCGNVTGKIIKMLNIEMGLYDII